MKNLPHLAVLAAFALTPACRHTHAPFDVKDTQVEQHPLQPGARVEIDNVNGDVTVEPWDKAQIEIEAERAATSRSALERLRVEVRAEPDHVTVHTRLPQAWWSGIRGQVSYHVRLPESARVEITTVNGRVRVSGISGWVSAQTVNGPVEIVDASSPVEVSGVNAPIDITFRFLPGDARHDISSVNGSITLRLPPDATGRFDVDTVTAGIRSDFDLPVEGGTIGHHLNARLGQGGGQFEISSVNGGVRILEAPADAEPDQAARDEADTSEG